MPRLISLPGAMTYTPRHSHPCRCTCKACSQTLQDRINNTPDDMLESFGLPLRPPTQTSRPAAHSWEGCASNSIQLPPRPEGLGAVVVSANDNVMEEENQGYEGKVTGRSMFLGQLHGYHRRIQESMRNIHGDSCSPP